MNKDLCKKKGRDISKVKASQKKYMAKFKQFNILLDQERDADIIEWMNKQPNKQQAVRNIIRSNAGI